MAIVGKAELKTDKDVDKEAEISLFDLFPYEERIKEFAVEADVVQNATRLKVTIAKLGSITALSDATREKGGKIHLWALLKYADTSRKLKTQEAIKKDETIAITVETV
jgi:hypothetical protein